MANTCAKFWRYCGIVLTGKKVPDRNIIGNVIRFPTTAADSTLFVTVPTSIPRETKKSGPITRNGRIKADIPMWAPKSPIPTTVISKNERIERMVYHMILEVSHSPFVNGVSDSCLNSFLFLYSEDMLTRENIGLVSTVNPTRPGTRKSMYLND